MEDAENLAIRFGRPEIDIQDGRKIPHFNVRADGYEDMHFWFFC